MSALSQSRAALEAALNKSRLGGVLLAVLIIASLVLIVLHTEYTDSAWIDRAQYVIGVVFLIEYILRIWLSDLTFPEAKYPRLKYIFSFNGIVDLLACLPVIIGPLIQDAAAIRALRLLRLAQLFRIRPVRRATLAIFNALKDSWDELLFSLMLSFTLILVGATAMYFVEGDAQPESFGSIPRALWWSTVTLTTVGYGDVTPITPLGKFVAICISIIGIAAVAMPAGILAAAFSKNSGHDLDANIFARKEGEEEE